MTTDALGRPVRFVVTAGQVNDATQANRLLDDLQTEHVIADKGYDSNKVPKRSMSLKRLPSSHPDPIGR